MAILTGVIRLGRDSELRFLADGTEVASIAAAYNYGKKDANGNRATQWLDCALFGKQAKAMQPYLKKGTMLDITLNEVHVETFQKGDGSTGTKLTGRVINIDFAGGGKKSENPSAPAQARTQAPPAPDKYDNFDDDIPF